MIHMLGQCSRIVPGAEKREGVMNNSNDTHKGRLVLSYR